MINNMTKTEHALHLIRVTRDGDILEHKSGKLYRVFNPNGISTSYTGSFSGPLPLNVIRASVIGQRDGKCFGPYRVLALEGIVRNITAEERGQ
jgi:hypothetical protein